MPARYIPARLVKGSDRWYIVYYQTDPFTGARERFRETYDLNRIKDLRERKRHAMRMIKDINDRLPAGYPFTERDRLMSVPICQAMDMALQIKMTDREKSRNTYATIKNIFVRWLKENEIDQIPVSEFTRNQALRFLDYVLLDRKVSNRTWNNYLLFMKILFNVLVEREYVFNNPFNDIKSKKVAKKSRRPFSKQEKKIVSQAIYEQDKTLMFAVLLIYHCFIRPVELRRIRFQHFDLDDQLIRLPAEITKNRQNSIVTIPDSMLSIFDKIRFSEYPDHYLIFGRLGKPHPEKSIGHHTLLRRHQDILQELKKSGKLDNIKGLSLYSWKDTGVLDLSKANINILETQKQLRHSNLQTTQIYTQSLRDKNKAIQKTKLSLLPDYAQSDSD